MFNSRFFALCSVWIAGSAVFSLIFDPSVTADRFVFAFSTLVVAGVVWLLEHLEWRHE